MDSLSLGGDDGSTLGSLRLGPSVLVDGLGLALEDADGVAEGSTVGALEGLLESALLGIADGLSLGDVLSLGDDDDGDAVGLSL